MPGPTYRSRKTKRTAIGRPWSKMKISPLGKRLLPLRKRLKRAVPTARQQAIAESGGPRRVRRSA